MPLADDLKKLARDAVADIGNTYQNMLWRDSGFAAPGQFGRSFSFDPRTAETANPGEPPSLGGFRRTFDVTPDNSVE